MLVFVSMSHFYRSDIILNTRVYYFTQGGRNDGATTLRPLNLDDFIQSKAKVWPHI